MMVADWLAVSAIDLDNDSHLDVAGANGSNGPALGGSSATAGSYLVSFRNGNGEYNDLAATAMPITGAAAFDFTFNGRSAGPAFDRATNTFTVDRNYTKALLDATVVGGGFGGSIADPTSQCCFNARSLV